MITQTTFFGWPLRTVAQRRFLVVLYYALLVGTTTAGVLSRPRFFPMLLTSTLVFGGLLGGIRAGGPVKAYAEPGFASGGFDEEQPVVLGLDSALQRAMRPRAWSPLDERETARRDRAHYQAYRLLLWILGGAVLTCWAAAQGVLVRAVAEVPVLLWMVLLVALSMPQAVLLWTEPEVPSGELAEVSAT